VKKLALKYKVNLLLEDLMIKQIHDIIDNKGEHSMRRSGKLHSISILRKVLVIMLMMCVFGSCSFARQIGMDLNKHYNVDAYVDKLTGFGTFEGITKSFERVDVNDDNTPFLYRQIKGKKNVWRIEIKNVRLKLKSVWPRYKDKYLRNFEVLVDPNTGHLLRIRSKFDGYDPNMLPEPTAEWAEARLRGAGYEIYHGLPDEPPEISFIQALNAIGGHPLLAKEIYALYVMESKMKSQPRPVWAITLRGIPPLHFITVPPGVSQDKLPPIWQRNHFRYVVNAVTGKVLFATTTPQPMDPEQKKKE